MTEEEIRIRIQAGTLDKDEAIAFVNERLAEMFEAVNGVRPEIPPGIPPHITLVSWAPTIVDYGHFVRRAQEAGARAQAASSSAETAKARATRAESAAAKSDHLLRNARKSLQEALAHLSGLPPVAEHEGERERHPAPYDPAFGDEKECRCGHPYYRHFDTYERMGPVGCKYCGCSVWQPAPDSSDELG